MDFEKQYPAYGGRGPECFKLGTGFEVVTTIIIVLRIYVRLRINKFGTAALLWTLAAYVFTILAQVFGALAVLHGLGNHLVVLAETGELRNFLFYTWITVFFFNIAIPVGKVAVASFLIEINAQTNPKIVKSLWAVAIINVVVNIPQAVIMWFQCHPYDALFDPFRQNQCDYRINQYYTYFVGAVAALSDFYFAIIPVTILIPLKIDRKLKIGLSFLMGLGVFAGVAAILRSWAARAITSDDPPYGNGQLFLWGEVEEWTVLIAMSIPPIWPLFRPLFQRVINTYTSRSRSKSSRQYKKDSGNQSTTLVSPTAGEFPPPSITTTIHVTSNKVDPTSPSSRHNLRFSQSAPPIEQPIDTESLGDRSTAVSQGSDGVEEPKRTNLPKINNGVRSPRRNNSRRLSLSRQEGWLELDDLTEEESQHQHQPYSTYV